MIEHRNFAIEDWRLRETALDLSVLANTESVFALSNGHIGLRGNLDEGEPHGIPGTYLNSFYEATDAERSTWHGLFCRDVRGAQEKRDVAV